MKFSLLSLALTVSTTASAQALFQDGRTTTFRSPGGVTEICRVPRRIAGPLAGFSKFKKDDLEAEAMLCGIDFYAGSGICPKLNSTNPGVLINELPDDMDKRSFERNHCGEGDRQQNVIAKYKQSISCSYTPSGLAYYQLSRLLGAGRVPVAVVRTMDKREHLRVGERASDLLRGNADIIAKTWGQLLNAHEQRPLPRNLFAADGQLYGFLAENPSGEDIYTEVSGVGDYDSRYSRFVQQPPFRRVSSSATVETLAGGRDPARTIPMLVQMKDVSDMVLLDTLLTQDDRIGNIHFKFRWYFLENGKWEEKKSKAVRPKKGKQPNFRGLFEAIVPQKEFDEMKAKSGILVKEMILKDNDCGVDVNKRTGNMLAIGALAKLRHMSGRTYRNFMTLAKFIDQNPDAAKDYFTKDLLFTPADYAGGSRSFLVNMNKARATLLANCRSGALKLDLNIDDTLPGAAPQTFRCDI